MKNKEDLFPIEVRKNFVDNLFAKKHIAKQFTLILFLEEFGNKKLKDFIGIF